MPNTPPNIDALIAQIEQMNTDLKSDSCGLTGPFINYPSSGAAPIIDFNIPQTTAFTTYGQMVKYIPQESFKDFTKKAPENNFYTLIEGMTAEQINALLHPNVVTAPDTGTFLPYSVPGATYLTAEDEKAGRSSTKPSTTAGGSPAGKIVGVSLGDTLGPVTYGRDTPMPFNGGVVIMNPKPVPNIANLTARNLRPILVNKLGNQALETLYAAKPPVPFPKIIVVEEYTTVSYLGNYGAGKVVKTMSLAPGERCTISVRTYKDMSSTRDKAQNVLDSFSESSASELDQLMQKEQGNSSAYSDSSGGSGSSFSTQTDSKNSSTSFGISGKINFGVGSIGGGYGRSTSEVTGSSSGSSLNYNYNSQAARASNINVLDSSMSKHVQQSNANRLINVNTTTSDMARSGEEESTVRELINYNKSRTLNLVFRQMLQEYTTITYLSGLKFAYTNGYMESYTVVDLNNLMNMLKDIIKETEVNNVLCTLLAPYCSVENYKGDDLTFLGRKQVTFDGSCLQTVPTCPVTTEVYYRVNPALEDTYTSGPLTLTFKGVILSVKKQTLQTSSTIMDALLGRGEALDCYNKNAQAAENTADFIANLASMQQVLDSVQAAANNQQFADKQLLMDAERITTMQKEREQLVAETDRITKDNAVVALQTSLFSGPIDTAKTDAFKKVFTNCCPTPQYTGGCGCGKCGE
jgi:hypothetical protein